MRVLVVDDEKLIVKGIRFSLEQEGMEVDCAYDGEEAYHMAVEALGLCLSDLEKEKLPFPITSSPDTIAIKPNSFLVSVEFHM